LAATPRTLISGSGSSSLKVQSTAEPGFPLLHTVTAHSLGCHHLAISGTYGVLASSGFEGSIKVWRLDAAEAPRCTLTIPYSAAVGQIWAVALSDDGTFLGGTTYDGKILVWDVGGEQEKLVQEYQTKGSFGMSIAMSRDGMFTASGHENGAVYVFNNETGRLLYSLPSKSDLAPARSFHLIY
jgi:superkiller protein 8